MSGTYRTIDVYNPVYRVFGNDGYILVRREDFGGVRCSCGGKVVVTENDDDYYTLKTYTLICKECGGSYHAVPWWRFGEDKNDSD